MDQGDHQCDKTTKATDVRVHLETSKRSLKAEGNLRSMAAASFSGHISIETSGTEGSGSGIEMDLVKDLDFSNPTPDMQGMKLDTVIKNQGQEVFTARASLNKTPGLVLYLFIGGSIYFSQY